MNGAMGHWLYNNTAQSVVPITNLGTRNVAKALVNAEVREDLSNPITCKYGIKRPKFVTQFTDPNNNVIFSKRITQIKFKIP